MTKSYLIPDWIFNDKECFKYFVRRYFDCEGCVDLVRKELRIEIYKSTELVDNSLLFLNQIKNGLFQYFAITTMRPFLLSAKVKRKCGVIVQGTRLKLGKQDNLAKFYENIGFDAPYKQARLKAAIT